MNLVIIDYGAGNIQSLKFAFGRLGVNAILSNDAEVIQAADKVIFPGVGHAGSAMEKLRTNHLDKLIPTLQQPVLGICLGMQLMCLYTEEANTKGLGIFNSQVKRFDQGLKVPQMGWNIISNLKGPLFGGLEEKHVYLVHSYYAELVDQTAAISDYGLSFSAALAKHNFFGVQFHPEKSGVYGSKILRNFLELEYQTNKV